MRNEQTSGAIKLSCKKENDKLDIIYLDMNEGGNHGHLVIAYEKEEHNRPAPSKSFGGLTAIQEEDSLIIRNKKSILWRINNFFPKACRGI